MGKIFSNKSGFSLIEVLVAMTIAAIAIGLIISAVISQQKNYITQERLVDMQQGLRAAMEVVGSEVKIGRLRSDQHCRCFHPNGG